MANYKAIENKGNPTIEVNPTDADQFIWTATSSKIKNGLLICGVNKLKNGKKVNLSIKIEGKPELQEAIEKLQKLQAEAQASTAERNAKISAIPGLNELKEAHYNVSVAYDAYERESDNGYPADEAIALREAEEEAALCREKYQVAAAYMLAESWISAANDMKSAVGRKGLERIINGEDYKIVLEAMDKEWLEAAERACENS